MKWCREWMEVVRDEGSGQEVRDRCKGRSVWVGGLLSVGKINRGH